MTLNGPWRKLILLLHVVTSVGFIGAVAAFLALVLTGALASDQTIMRAAYVAAGITTWDVIVPLAWVSLLIGVLQSLTTPWGLFRYYWVIVKLVLSIIAVVVLMLQTQNIAIVAQTALANQTINGSRPGLILHATGGLVVLVVITILSIYKPRGLTPHGARQIDAQAQRSG